MILVEIIFFFFKKRSQFISVILIYAYIIIYSVGCFNEVRYSLFLCFIDSFSPSVSHGKQFLYYVLPLSQESIRRIYL